MTIEEDADAFGALYRRFDHVLKRSPYARKGRKRLEADWKIFAASLTEGFFAEVRDSGAAVTLISEPPRILMRRSGMFEPAIPESIDNVADLFVRGVCQVRHNYFHGEKFTGGREDRDRDHRLIVDATRVLELAADRHPQLGERLRAIASETGS